jgi:HD superfamily phosphohydrolase YqeK
MQLCIPFLDHPAEYMTTKEKEDWVAVCHDFWRNFSNEKLSQYIANISLHEKNIKRRKRKGNPLDALV